jgi:hypothetical protein
LDAALAADSFLASWFLERILPTADQTFERRPMAWEMRVVARAHIGIATNAVRGFRAWGV